ncbi:MAG TPA: HDOD domain-containing protein, partial [Rhodospirillales bacterium]|nr:HDOD domain-containing protein [Rhodospirillales bacterium]
MNESAANESLLSRQPILDQQQELVGYELTLVPAVDNELSSPHRSRAAALICATYAELGIRSALGRHRAFLPVAPDFLHDDAIEALPPDAVVLELVLDSVPDERLLERCRTLRERRYSLALANYTGLDERSRSVLILVDVVKIDVRQCDDAMLGELAGPLARLPLRLLAQGVATQEAMERCRNIGFQLFQGNYFARPEIVSGRRLTASQASLIQLINLAGRDAESIRIEDGFKHDPALAVNLLRIVNSVGYGGAQRVSSLRHAITLLGRRQLQRWLQLLLMTPAGKAADTSRSPLLQVAALRGRMMEMLIEHSHPRQRKLADQAFIAGIMSMMPAALGLPMNEIFGQITLEPEIMQALSSEEGALGKTLAL